MTFTTPTERDRYRTRSIRNVIQTTIVRPLSKKRLITFRILRAVVPAYRARRRRHRRVKTAPFALAAGRPRRARRRLERHFSAARRSGGRRARRESLVRRRVRVWILRTPHTTALLQGEDTVVFPRMSFVANSR